MHLDKAVTAHAVSDPIPPPGDYWRSRALAASTCFLDIKERGGAADIRQCQAFPERRVSISRCPSSRCHVKLYSHVSTLSLSLRRKYLRGGPSDSLGCFCYRSISWLLCRAFTFDLVRAWLFLFHLLGVLFLRITTVVPRGSV